MPLKSIPSRALLALVLLVPAPSLGVITALFLAPGPLGQALFAVVKVWLVLLPLLWTWRVERQSPIRLHPLTTSAIQMGLALGVLACGAIAGAYWLLGPQWINFAEVRAKAEQVGITGPTVYWIGAAYWTLINALIEEYVWRNFVYRNCEVLVGTVAAIFLAALCFTLHHTLALTGYFQDWRVVILGSLGVFTAGAVWSAVYAHSRSIWPSYLSHLLADLAIAIVGWHILFSNMDAFGTL